MRSEQKAVFTKNPVQKFSKPGNMVWAMFAGNLCKVELGQFMDMQSRMVGCDKDSGCVEK